MTRVVVLGTGTGVGKTHVTVAIARALHRLSPTRQVLCVKVVETGMPTFSSPPSGALAGSPTEPRSLAGTDAAALANASFHVKHLSHHPLVALVPPISPHLAARRAGVELEPESLAAPILHHTATHCNTSAVTIVETAGGAFSPLSERATNIELARALEPAKWLLVAPDSLGVLHDIRACLHALQAVARPPDAVVLSAARPPDASTGTNAAELERLGLPTPAAVFGREHPPDLRALFTALGVD